MRMQPDKLSEELADFTKKEIMGYFKIRILQPILIPGDRPVCIRMSK